MRRVVTGHDQEQRADSSGLAELIEPDGMHATPTVDYGIVLQGEILLELDDGHRTRLSAGDKGGKAVDEAPAGVELTT
ncbi:hypothetical protein ABZZ16_36280, partial [Streptomyces sp. NPDC006386]